MISFSKKGNDDKALRWWNQLLTASNQLSACLNGLEMDSCSARGINSASRVLPGNQIWRCDFWIWLWEAHLLSQMSRWRPYQCHSCSMFITYLLVLWFVLPLVMHQYKVLNSNIHLMSWDNSLLKHLLRYTWIPSKGKMQEANMVREVINASVNEDRHDRT